MAVILSPSSRLENFRDLTKKKQKKCQSMYLVRLKPGTFCNPVHFAILYLYLYILQSAETKLIYQRMKKEANSNWPLANLPFGFY